MGTNMAEGEPSRKLYWVIAGALMALLAMTVGAYYLPLGSFGAVVALSIAATKAILVALFFMHLKYEHPVTRLFSIGGLAWLTILMGLTLGDYLTRAYAG